MPPNSRTNVGFTGVLNEDDVETVDGGINVDVKSMQEFGSDKQQYIWRNMVVFAVAHAIGLYGLWQMFVSAKVLTGLFALMLYGMAIVGVSAGVHRLWSHRAYKATFLMRLVLVVFSTIAHQNSAIHWAREHRVHHKFSETNADPVNAARGFFFSHVGWLLVKKHPDVTAKGKLIDVSDLFADPLLVFQRKYYKYCALVVSIIVPLIVPVYCWHETWTNSFCIAVALRWVCSLNAVWLVNSAAHMYGNRPYDANITPSENVWVAILTAGEGFHNYHHTFPWDYKTSELGNPLNLSKLLIDTCAKLGLAYDLKTVSPEIIAKRTIRTGDGSKSVWGWGDVDQDAGERADARVMHARQR